MSFAAFAGPVILLLIGQPSPEGLEQVLQPMIRSHEGEVAVALKHLPSGLTYSLDADKPMPTASLIKISVMVEAYHQAQQGKVNLDTMITLKAEDKVPGSGILTTHFSPGLSLSLRDAIRLMMVYSDNTATNLVLDAIGLAAPTAYMSELGLPETRIHAKVFRRDTSIDPERSKQYGLGSTTAAETVALLEKIYTGKLGNDETTKEMLAHMKACEEKYKATRLLPPQTVVYHKGGSVNTSRTLGAIVETDSGPVILSVLTDKNKDRSWSATNAGDMLCSRITRAVFDYFAKDQPTPPADVTLSLGSAGPKVEVLQRTLNARLNPSMDVTVDGEFGPQTDEAVQAFQRKAKLPVTGKVDAATWKALQPLVSNAPELPDPEVVNQQTLPAAPADPLEGPPYVTAKAWAIADGDAGTVLWQSEDNSPRDFASVTKMMTAYIILRLAEKEPAVLDEVVTFSERADATLGSTSGVQAGEQVSVRELLYGLLLPSGNDASVALAEHFGERLAIAGGDSATSDPVDSFVAEMNRTAKELGMEQTNYVNPHGLTAPDHLSTPADQARLVHHALRLPSFRQYISTRQRGARLATAEGIARNVIWRNTNELLGIEGYEGVKTGTTTAAGACLASTAVRDGRRLVVVVLGSSSSDGRYADTRNLYRWAWNQLAQQAAE